MGKSADSSRSRGFVYDAVGAEAGDAAEDGGAGEADVRGLFARSLRGGHGLRRCRIRRGRRGGARRCR